MYIERVEIIIVKNITKAHLNHDCVVVERRKVGLDTHERATVVWDILLK